MKKLILTYIILILNICFLLNLIVYNEELIICLSLSTAFFIIFNILKKLILKSYFEKIDEIYYNYFILLFLNKWININFLKNMEKIIYHYKNINVNYFLILIKDLLQVNIINPNLNRVLINITEIYKYILNLQIINNKNLYLILTNKYFQKNQYIILYAILQQLIKNKLIK